VFIGNEKVSVAEANEGECISANSQLLVTSGLHRTRVR
jgi:hypothetical protein